MSDDAAREDACREYQSSLEDLTFNSKPHINMLTILAEENLHFAKDIVAIIEAQIVKVFMKIEFFSSQYGFDEWFVFWLTLVVASSVVIEQAMGTWRPRSVNRSLTEM